MARGRPPKPSAMKKLAGNPGKRALNDTALRATVGMPDPPADLPPEVRAQWDRAGALLVPTGVLTTLDGHALLILARAAADYLNLCGKAPPGSDVLATDEGKLYWNPFAAARDKAEARLLKMLAEFGLTPVSREKVKGANPSEETNPFLEFMKNGVGTDN